MKKISTADLKDREVINLCGGEKLGYPCEFEINLDDGKITAIIIENSAIIYHGKSATERCSAISPNTGGIKSIPKLHIAICVPTMD